MSRWRSVSFLFPTLVALAAAAPAQDLLPKGRTPLRPVVLRNAVLHTLDRGTIVGGTLWFDEGVIRGVLAAGDRLELPGGVEPLVVDAAGKHVFPGLIAASSQLGLIEIGMVRQTVDTDETGDLSPEALAAVAVNPDSTALPVARSNGVLTAGVFPVGGLLPGRASVVQLDGWTNADMTVLADAGPIVAWPSQPTPGGRGGRGRRMRPGGPGGDDDADPAAAARTARDRIDEEFARSKAWLERSMVDPTTPPDLRAQALLPALRGETAVFLLAQDLEAIESAVLWAIGKGLRPVVVGGRDALLCADLLVQYRVPVILLGTHKLPRRDDSPYDEAFALPGQLAARGVKFCLATGEEFAHERNLPYHAATAAAFGLDRERALAAITRDAAGILGVGDRLGTLTVGKMATLFVADGHPFELPTRIERAWVAGREVDLRNKQTVLAEKYRQKYRDLDAGK